MALTDELVERSRSHALRQRCEAGRHPAGCVVEEIRHSRQYAHPMVAGDAMRDMRFIARGHGAA
jgi:hypothetical protein